MVRQVEELLSEANIFVQDEDGVKVHIKLAGHREAMVLDVVAMLGELREAGFVPDATFRANGSPPAKPAFQKPTPPAKKAVTAPPRKQASDVPECAYCGGAMWDNRNGKRNPNAPDFKCKDKDECNGAAWIKDDGELSWKQ